MQCCNVATTLSKTKQNGYWYCYASARLIDGALGIMFSGCPFVCACVRVEVFPTNLPSTCSFWNPRMCVVYLRAIRLSYRSVSIGVVSCRLATGCFKKAVISEMQVYEKHGPASVRQQQWWNDTRNGLHCDIDRASYGFWEASTNEKWAWNRSDVRSETHDDGAYSSLIGGNHRLVLIFQSPVCLCL